MNCNQVRDHMLDLNRTAGALPAEAEAHVRACPDCAGELAALRRTMSLLDEWKAPEVSPYFDSRLAARLREEAARPRGLLGWLEIRWQPAALAAALALAVGVGVYQMRVQTPPPVVQHNVARAKPGTAVGDLQALEKNQELYSTLDMFDEETGENP
jgi:anti-sigma factor RsiW